MKNRLTAILLTAAIMIGVVPFVGNIGAATMEAAPAQSTTPIRAYYYDYPPGYPIDTYRIDTKVPIYTIQQSNGYSANYMRLRDIAYYLDFDVVWTEDDPNSMYLYTNHHYLDAYTPSGPATETKTATASSMDIYIDGVKVKTDITPVMIDNNNYFKIRDIAQLMDFWCVYYIDQWNCPGVNLFYGYGYADEAAIAAGAKMSDYAKTIEYELPVWYDEDSDILSDTPVTYTARDAWGNYDYTKLYFGETNPTMNAIAQLILDRNVIEQDHSGVEQFEDGNTLNAYYRYPLVEYKTINSLSGSGVMPTDVSWVFSEWNGSNFGANLRVRELPTSSVSGEIKVGVLSIEYNDEYYAAAERTKQTAASILKQMNTYDCDADKIRYLASVVEQKMSYYKSGATGILNNKDAYDRAGLNGYTVLDLPDTQTEISEIWADNNIYIGVCAEYSKAFKNLLNAAGYYFVSDTTSLENHVDDVVWVPDEGRWMLVDTTNNHFAFIERSGDGTWVCELDRSGIATKNGVPITTELPKYCDNNTFILDLFYLLEDIKPGGWLNSDPKLNP